MVFCGMYPAAANDYQELRDALERLQLNDASFQFQADNSDALGLGFRLGFLGLLHMEIVQERLEREFDLTLVTTVPNVAYHVYTNDGSMVTVESASKMPPPGEIDRIEEPYIEAEIISPTEYLSPIIDLCKKKRGIHVRVDYLDARRCIAIYKMPLAEIVLDFFDKLKTCSRGYGSLEYRLIGYQPGDLVKLDILLNGEPVDALSSVVHRNGAEWVGRTLASKLRKLIPRQQFEVAIQAAIGSRILVRETVKALAQERDGQVLRRRYHPETQAPGKTEGRQTEDEAGGIGRGSAGGVYGAASGKRGIGTVNVQEPKNTPGAPGESPAKSILPALCGTVTAITGPWSWENARSWFKVIALVLLVRWLWFEPFSIPSNSMAPTLIGDPRFLRGDRVAVNKFIYGPRVPFMNKRIFRWHDPQRWDIVVFKNPDPDAEHKTLIKRVVGLPGEYIHIEGGLAHVGHSENGEIRWEALEFPEGMPPDMYYTRDGRMRYGVMLDEEYSHVPEDHYLVLGDNSARSGDGRYFGWVPRENLVGRAFCVWWPLAHRRDFTGFSRTWWGRVLLYGVPAGGVLYLLLTSLVVASWRVRHGVLPGMPAKGQRILVNRLAFGVHLPYTKTRIASGRSPFRDETVVYYSPGQDGEEGGMVLGRVLALPGSKVEIGDGRFWVDGEDKGEATGGMRAALDGKAVVPNGRYLVQGDHPTGEPALEWTPRDDLVGSVAAVWGRREVGSESK